NGSKYYANNAKSKKDNIIGVLNIDMSAYDSDNDKNFDIDVNNNTNSLAIKDLLLKLVDTYKFDLIGNVVNPGTSDSDHASFWPTYGALLLGECWSKKDVTPFYHSSKDRASSLNWRYYFEMTKLAIAYVATAAVPVKQSGTVVTQFNNTLTASAGASSYQWLDCNNLNKPIPGQTGQTFTATQNGNYAVRTVTGGCAAISECFSININGMEEAVQFRNSLKLFPNPATDQFSVDLGRVYQHIRIEITDVNGKLKYAHEVQNEQNIPVQFIHAPGVYFVAVKADNQQGTLKLVKTQQ
ncbi:MAG TPA: M28 family peptidase, partial [Bacteroidia bacterium]|nr:M28 family peptidase [Bacteroidia bacterium]